MTQQTPQTPRRGAPPSTPLGVAIAKVRDRANQLAPGAASLPFHGGEDSEKGRTYWDDRHAAWTGINPRRREAGTLGQDGALAENLFAALGTEDPTRRKAELLELAAAAIASALAIKDDE